MALLPHVAAHLASRPLSPPFQPPPADQLGEYFASIRTPFPVGDGPDVADVRDETIRAGLTIRVYRPEIPAPCPVIVYLHGGSFVVGDLDMHDTTCRHLANQVGATVVNVDYRLAPEHPFPAPLDDCFDALCWSCEHAANLGGDPTRVVIAGSSAGGTLAAACAIRARDEGFPPLAAQLLIYPAIDVEADTASWREFGDGYGLDAIQGRWGWHLYLADAEDRVNPLGSPARVASTGALAPAIVLTAECDPLRDEAEDYARRLEVAGVPVRLVRVPGQIHGFLIVPALADDATRALAALAGDLRKLLA